VSYFSTNNKEQKYITRQRNKQYKTIQKWDASTTDTTHAQYHVWFRLKHITTLLICDHPNIVLATETGKAKYEWPEHRKRNRIKTKKQGTDMLV